MLSLFALAAIFSNEELVYFEKEAGRAPPPWTSVKLDGQQLRFVDAHGRAATPIQTSGHSVDGDTLTLRLPDGGTRQLRRARSAICWAALLKGKDDWHFVRGLQLHDGGGRVLVEAAGARPALLRMRNVAWPSGPNRPSLVLYVHTPDDPEQAVSYAWADPQAKRVGINLRWMQASCTIDDNKGETE